MSKLRFHKELQLRVSCTKAIIRLLLLLYIHIYPGTSLYLSVFLQGALLLEIFDNRCTDYGTRKDRSEPMEEH